MTPSSMKIMIVSSPKRAIMRLPFFGLLAACVFCFSAIACLAQGVSITTFHGGNARLGWNDQEVILTPAAVKSRLFGKLWERPLGGKVTGSPLYVSRLEIAGHARAVVYAATDDNSISALDAANGHPLWVRRQLAPVPRDWRGHPDMGILGTPVIDLDSRTLYACSVRVRGLRQIFQVWALDIRTGATRPGWPVTLAGMDRGCRFEAGQLYQRGALALQDGWVYAPFGGRGDAPPWHGWVMGVNTRLPGDPQRAYCASPRADGAGIWSGGGVSADTNGALYAVTGNGDPDAALGGDSIAQSVIRLTVADGSLQCSLQPRDFYTPANFRFLNDQDEDLGGATALVLPDQLELATPHLLFVGGKDGLGYLLNRDNLGGVGGEIWKTRLFSTPEAPYHEGIRSTASYFDAGPAGHLLYVAGDEPGPDNAKGMAALQIVTDPVTGRPSLKRLWTLPDSFDGPSSPYGSSSGVTGGIVWVVETKNSDRSEGQPPSILHAYDALTGAELYSSNRGPASDRLTAGRRFSSPIVADGRVFIGTAGVVCYGQKGR